MNRTSKCRLCGKPIRYVARRFAWVHESPSDHAPLPPKEVFG